MKSQSIVCRRIFVAKLIAQPKSKDMLRLTLLTVLLAGCNAFSPTPLAAARASRPAVAPPEMALGTTLRTIVGGVVDPTRTGAAVLTVGAIMLAKAKYDHRKDTLGMLDEECTYMVEDSCEASEQASKMSFWRKLVDPGISRKIKKLRDSGKI